MFKRKFLGLSLVAAALLSLQMMPAGVDTANSGIAHPCSSKATMVGGPYCTIVCPQGDAFSLATLGATISVTAKDNTGAPIVGILLQDFWLVGCSNGLILCGGSACIDATANSDVNGMTTIAGSMAASLYDLTGVKVVIQGTVVANPLNWNLPLCLAIKMVSADLTGDGFADGGDFAIYTPIHFAPGYTPATDEKANFNCDADVDGGDFALIGPHVVGAGHQCN